MIGQRSRRLAVLAAFGLAAACAPGPGTETAASGASGPAAKASAPSAAMLERGRASYVKNCAACHGEGGRGDGPAAGVMKPPPRDHTDAAYMSTLSDKDIADIIRMGGALKGKPLMPGAPQINGEELTALVAHVRSLADR